MHLNSLGFIRKGWLRIAMKERTAINNICYMLYFKTTEKNGNAMMLSICGKYAEKTEYLNIFVLIMLNWGN